MVALWRKERSKGDPCSIQKIEMQGQQMGLLCFREFLIPLVMVISAFFSTSVRCGVTILVPAPVVIAILGNTSLI